MPRVSVTISESPSNLTKQLRDRTEMGELIKSLPETYREAMAIAFSGLCETTSLKEDQKESLKEALALEQIKARLASIAEITNTEASVNQGKLMTLQTGAQIEKVIAMLDQMQQEKTQRTPDMINQGPQGQGQGFEQPVSPENMGQGQLPAEQQPPETMSQQNINEPQLTV